MKKEEIKKKTKTCNQCHQSPMRGVGNKLYYFCPRPDCPNFALLQIPVECLEPEDLTFIK